MFPRNGLAPGVNNSGVALTVQPASGCEALYYNEQCPQKVDPRALNLLMSELVEVVNACESERWECSRTDNLLRAMQCLFTSAGNMSLRAHGLPQTFHEQTTEFITGWSGTDFNSFSTSTFSGGVFTAGAGEGGTFDVSLNVWLANWGGTRAHAYDVFFVVNGGSSPSSNNPVESMAAFYEFSDNNELTLGSFTSQVRLNAGDQLRIGIYSSVIGATPGAANMKFSETQQTNLIITRTAP